jgi:hypothetical protein
MPKEPFEYLKHIRDEAKYILSINRVLNKKKKRAICLKMFNFELHQIESLF